MDNISTQLSSLAITRSLILQRVANGLSKSISQAYLSVIDDVTKQLKSGDDINIKNVNKIIKELQSRMEVNLDIESDLTKLGMSEAQWAQSSVNGAVGIDLMSKLPTEATIAKIVGDSYIEGATINEWFNGVNDSMKNDLKKSVRVGMLEGETTIQIAKRVRDSLGVSLNHADSISRTAVATVSNNARMATYEANDDVMKGWEHLSALDNRTSQVCATRDGATWDLDHKGINDKGKKFPFQKPPLHFRCLTGDTLISTRYPISYISKRKYEGIIYTISTSAGNSIRCTPNHPILTDRGFVEAQFLNKLDKIATDCIGEGLRVLDNQDKKGVSTIENLFSSIGESFGVLPVKMPVSPEDFHSDVTDNEVDVIFIDRELWLERYAMINEVLTDSSFVNANPSISYISSLNEGFMRLCNSFSGIVTIFNLIKSSLFVHNRPLNKLLLGLCSRFNALSDKLGLNKSKWNIKPTSNTSKPDSIIIESNSALESKGSISPFISIFGKSTSLSNNSNNDFVSDSKLSRNITNGSIGDKVFFDDIVDIVSAECVTHVYNLENDMGYYTANNLITHNCRSLLSPLLKSYEELGLMGIDIPEGTRSSMDGQVSSGTNFEKWFESKDSKFQEKYLGKQRYEMFKAGKITFNDLVGQNGMTLTIKELGMIDNGVMKVPTIDFGYDGKFNHYVADIRDEAKIVIDKLPKPLSMYELDRGLGDYGDYNDMENKLGISPSLKNDKVFIHEYGHHIEYVISDRPTKRTVFKDAYELDRELFSSFKIGKHNNEGFLTEAEAKASDKLDGIIEKIFNKTTKERYLSSKDITVFKNVYSEKNNSSIMIFDTIDATTKGMLSEASDKFVSKYAGLGGHGVNYFSSNERQLDEVFANMFAVWSDKKEWATMKEIMPNTAKEFENIMQEIING